MFVADAFGSGWEGVLNSNADVAVGVIIAGGFVESGVEADSVANRSIVGRESGAVTRPNPNVKIPKNTTKPQTNISPAAIQSVRVLLVIIPLFYLTSPSIAIIGSASAFG